MKSYPQPGFDLFALLMEEWLPLEIDPRDTSADAKLIFLVLLAIAEQLKNARSDRDPYAGCTHEDFEEMARQAMEDSYRCAEIRHDSDPAWTEEDFQDLEGGDDDR